MKVINLLIVLFALLISGCGSSNNVSLPKIETTKQFQLKEVKVVLSSSVKTKIVYHTEDELENLLNKRLKYLLNESDLLSINKEMNALSINANYQRAHVGEATPFPSDSLAYPGFAYDVNILDKNKVLGTISKHSLTYKGGFLMNLQVIAASLRDKKYEIDFINSLANSIVEDIKDLQ